MPRLHPIPHFSGFFCDNNKYIYEGEVRLRRYVKDFIADEFVDLDEYPLDPAKEWTDVADSFYEMNDQRAVRYSDDHKEGTVWVEINGYAYTSYFLWFETFKLVNEYRDAAHNWCYKISPYGHGIGRFKDRNMTRYCNLNSKPYKFDTDNLPPELRITSRGELFNEHGENIIVAINFQANGGYRDIQLLIEEAWIPLHHRALYEDYRYLSLVYPHLKFKSVFSVNVRARYNLLCFTRPEMFQSYADKRDPGLIHTYCNKYYGWYCHKHQQKYSTNPSGLVANHVGCTGCHVTAEQRSASGTTSNQVARDNELHQFEILQEIYGVDNVRDSSATGRAKEDFQVFVNEDWRGLQSKRLRKAKGGNYAASIGNYDDKMLMLFSNAEDSKYVCCYYEEVKYLVSDLGIRFSDRARTLLPWRHSSKESVVAAIKALLPQAIPISEITNRLGATDQIEQAHKDRLFTLVRARGMTVDETDIGAQDCRINNYVIQLKYATRQNGLRYSFHASRGYKKRPYSVEDKIDFFIFEGGQHLGNFFIISAAKMVELGILKTSTQEGKLNFSIPLPEDTTDILHCHWNDFSALDVQLDCLDSP